MKQRESAYVRRQRLLKRDSLGRTPLFYAAEQGNIAEVKEMIFSFGGTGMYPPRLAFISMKDNDGRTAADLAEEQGHKDISQLLGGEQGRMEYFE